MNHLPKMDKRWDIFYGKISFDEFTNEKMPKPHFKNEVNEEIKKAFEVVSKLLAHSYYEYLFIDIAVSRALQIVEMALVIRYRELNNGEEWVLVDKPLKNLFGWFLKRHYFEYNSFQFLEHVRDVRNYLVHPKGHNFGGTASLHWIDTTCEIINGLYEDVELRKKRWADTNDFSIKLNEYLKQGGKLLFLGQVYYIYAAGPLKIDNRADPVLCYFSLFPFFDSSSTQVKSPIVLSYPFSQISLNNSVVDFSLGAGKITLTNVLKGSEKRLINYFKGKVISDQSYGTSNKVLAFIANQEIRKLLNSSVRKF